jgi:acyl-CoA synthetase (AMP-forming)/AMP-acid ligase II
VPGVVVRVGDDPARPAAAGEVGRVWYRSDQHMVGYGFPPDVEPAEQDDGWFPSGDHGALDAHGCLVLAGRVDDSFKTPGGHLVSPGEIVATLSRCPGVRAVEVLPLARPLGADIGVLIEGVEVSQEAVRAHAAASLPAWAQPQALRVVAAIPRTAHGKVDQLACRDLLAAGPA